MPPATTCDVTFDPELVVVGDPRPGKDPGRHKMITTMVELRMRTDDQEYRVTGSAHFFATRGDSAIPPPRDTGRFPVDSTRWLIDRWEDETLPETLAAAGGSARPAEAQPALNHTWGAIKAIYRRDSHVAPAP